MQRYFVSPSDFKSNTVSLTGDDAHHFIHVMRAKPGDRFVVNDGAGRSALVEAADFSERAVTARIVEWLPACGEPGLEVWIAQSLPKADKMELIIQKGTEIGAAGFWPFLSARTVVQYDGKKEAKRLERWRKIAKEAAEQAGRGRIPAIEAPLTWKEMLAVVRKSGTAFICYEKENGRGFKSALQEALAQRSLSSDTDEKHQRLVIIVGPEGGFTEEEIEQAEEAGIVPVGLGARILRTETAAMVALSCILYETGEMGG